MAKPKTVTKKTRTVQHQHRAAIPPVKGPPTPPLPDLPPLTLMPVPYTHPGAYASNAAGQQIDASLGALPTQETVAAPYLHQQANLSNLSEAAITGLKAAAAYRSDLARGIAGLTQSQGAAAAQSTGGVSPQAAAAAPGDASTLGGYGTNAAAATGAEIGSIPGWTTQYQSAITQHMQQELDRVINQPRQQILAQRPALYQTIFDRVTAARQSAQAANQNARTQHADLAGRWYQYALQGYQDQQAAGTKGQPAQDVTTTNTGTETDPAAGTAGTAGLTPKQLVDLRAKYADYADRYAKAVRGRSTSTTSQNVPGYMLNYTWSNTDLSGTRHNYHGSTWINAAQAKVIQANAKRAGNPQADWLHKYMPGVPARSAIIGGLQPVAAGQTYTEGTSQGYVDALANVRHHLETLNSSWGLGYTQEQIDRDAVVYLNTYWPQNQRPKVKPKNPAAAAPPPKGPKPSQGQRP